MLTTLAPRRHRYHVRLAGVPLASATTLAAAQAYLVWATSRHLDEIVEHARGGWDSADWGVFDTAPEATGARL